MAEYDLSFLEKPAQPKTQPAPQSQQKPQQAESEPEYDTSFAVVDPDYTPEKAAERKNRGVLQSISDFFTGNDRETPETERMGEFDLPFEVSGRQIKTALGLLTTFDPKGQVNILKENYPDLKFSEDAKGNIIVDGSAYGAPPGVLNMPGISGRVLLQAGFQFAAFTPAARFGQMMSGAKAGATVTGLSSAGTQVLQDLSSQAAGRTSETSFDNVDYGDVGLAGLFGAGGDVAGRLLSRFLPTYRKQGTVTPEIRQGFKQAAVEAGRNPDEVTDDLIASWMRAADEATNLQGARQIDPQAVQQTDEFGIPFTRGQAMQASPAKVRQMSMEDTLSNTSAGPGARAAMDDFRNLQNESIETAAGKVQESLGGGRRIVDRPNQAAANLADDIQGRAAALDKAVGEAYDAVGDAFLAPEGVKGLANNLKTFARQEGFELSRELAPATRRAMEKTDELLKALDVKGGARVRPFHIRKVESMRRQLNDLVGAAANPTDKRQMTRLKQQFDASVNDAIDAALFSGDEGAMEALKEARGLSAEYFRQFARRDTATRTGRPIKDQAGDIIERIVADDPTIEQVSNYLFGASKLGAKNTSAKLAGRVKDLVGADSETWQGIRQAAFLKLAEPTRGDTISGKVFLKRLNEATSGSGESFMKELFSPDEIAQMRRFAAAVQRAQPDRANPSGTAYKLTDIASQTGENIIRMLGFSQGPITGAVTEGGIQAKGLIRNMRNASKAIRATRAFQRKANTAGVPQTVAPAGAVSGRDAEETGN